MSKSRRELDELAMRLADGLLSPEERSRIIQQATTDAELASAVERDVQLDATLRTAFSPPLPTFRGGRSLDGQAVRDSVSITQPKPDRPSASRRRVLWYAIAASVAWGILGWQWLIRPSVHEIAFVQRPLTEVYETCVEEGFQPYWVCKDDAVFAETFRRRQGVSVKLLELPPGSAMAGLSYLGGLSDESTSMLAYVDGGPVIVVVDRIKNDWRPPVGFDEATGLHVFREERAGLVFYEVAPFPEARLLKFFQPIAAEGQE